MPEIDGSQTHSNIIRALEREAVTVLRYRYFAKIAEIEGQIEVAKHFNELADSESGHAFGHLDWLREHADPLSKLPIGDTEYNLNAAIAAELSENTNFYPDMAKVAENESFPELADWFTTLARAEGAHAHRLRLLLDNME